MEMKYWWWMVAGLVLVSVASSVADDAVDDGEDKALIRNERAAKGKANCRYSRGDWSECDPKTQLRTRIFTLKHGDNSCEHTRTVHKKCKKSCRYEKTAWSDCNASGEMSRTDTLKANSDPSCEKTKRVTKKCNKNKQAKSSKDKGRRIRQ